VIGRRVRQRGRLDRRASLPIMALSVVTVATVFAGPSLTSGLSQSLRHDEVAAPAPEAAPTADLQPAMNVPTTTDTMPLVASQAPIPPTADSTTTAPTPTIAPVPAVTVIQTVPPLRDVIVTIDGVRQASDAAGRIVLSPSQQQATVGVVGLETTPALQLATFSGWADGDVATTRSLASIAGPVAQIGFVISNRVVATAPAAEAGSVRLSSDDQSLDLVLGQPTWVLSARADPIAGGVLVPRAFSYVARSVVVDGIESPVPWQVFAPTPEALWVVTA
jgi:hypothetical protein